MMKRHFFAPFGNEGGFALVIAMIMLVIMAIIGINAGRNATTELNVAGNERMAIQVFNAADSGWHQAMPFLNNMSSAPEHVNISAGFGADGIVRNFGNGGDGVQNANFPDGTEDGSFPTMMNIRYWYKVTLMGEPVAATGSGSGYNTYNYGVQCDAGSTMGAACCPGGMAGGASEIVTTVLKNFKTDY